ncbi:FAD-linked oxidase C-terminal domain-containing protein [Streptomyces sp. NPDC046866]|uniref:FAD-binding oxidoreductase n=1 Tax=Streptomyces sp. NPDC046866 TaxID=3154921 RepID=UPI00345720F4
MSLTVDSPLLPDRLRDVLPPDAVLTDEASLAAHARDATPFPECGTPAAVVRPTTAEQVQAVLALAYELEVPVVPQGARTGVVGAAGAVDGCIVLSTVRMDRILQVDPGNRLARCEPGVTTAALNAAAAEHGLMYPPDPTSREVCTIGGNIATGAGGIRSAAYGATADHVLALDLVLPDGRRMRTGRGTVKGVAGYDLTRLVVGSEGTLAVVVGATLALRPARPPALALLAQFPSLTAAGDALAAIALAGHAPCVLELLDRATSEAVAGLGHPLLRPGGAATLVVESDTADPVRDLAAMKLLCKEAGADHVVTATTVQESRAIMEARLLAVPAVSRLAAALPGAPTPCVEDVAVPRFALPKLITTIEGIADHHGLPIFTTAHAGDGRVRPAVLFDGADAGQLARARQACEDIVAAALALGGTSTGTHGIGTLKRDWLARELDPAGLELHRGVKRLFDPKNLLNPGKVIEA